MFAGSREFRRIRGTVAGSRELSQNQRGCCREGRELSRGYGNCHSVFGNRDKTTGIVTGSRELSGSGELSQDQGNCGGTKAIVAATQGQIEEPEK